MIRIYYDPTTGVINQIIDVKYGPEIRTWIDSDQDQIKVNEWKVNPITKKLEPLSVTPSIVQRGS